MQDLKALEGKSLAELREIAKALGIKNVMIKKRELIEKIAGTDTPEEAPAENEAGAKGEVSETAAKPSRSRSTPSTSATARRTAARALAATSPIRATLRAPATSRRSRTMATFPFNLTAGRPADDQKQATNKRPQKGGDDRGMAASASDTQGSPQTVRRC